MPLYLKNKIVFVHIPKTGGTSFGNTMRELGDDRVFNGIKTLINGHSAQHSTFQELKGLTLVPKDFRVVSVVRNPYTRFLSKYNEQCTFNGYKGTTEDFSRKFFADSYAEWDSHNMPMHMFLEGAEDAILIRFENLEAEFREKLGITITSHQFRSTRHDDGIPPSVKERILRHWGLDFELYGYDK